MKEAQNINIRDEFADFEIEDDSNWYDVAGLGITKLLLLISIIIGFGLYVGNLIYGVNSLTVLEELTQKEAHLTLSIEKLKEENARLQKEYFELKGLEPK